MDSGCSAHNLCGRDALDAIDARNYFCLIEENENYYSAQGIAPCFFFFFSNSFKNKRNQWIFHYLFAWFHNKTDLKSSAIKIAAFNTYKWLKTYSLFAVSLFNRSKVFAAQAINVRHESSQPYVNWWHCCVFDVANEFVWMVS